MNSFNKTKMIIEQFDWTLFQVSSSKEGHSIPFCYTVGLTESYGLPELIFIGEASPQKIHDIMTYLVHKMKDSGFAAGVHTDVIERLDGKETPLELQLVNTQDKVVRDEFADQLFEYYGWLNSTAQSTEQTIPRLAQVFWPDKEGRLPSHAKFNMHDKTIILPILTPAESEMESAIMSSATVPVTKSIVH